MFNAFFKNNSGSSPWVVVLVIAVIAVGGYFTYQQANPQKTENEMMEDADTEDDGAMMDISSSPESQPVTGDQMMDHAGDSMGDAMELKFSGKVLAGTVSPLLDFTKADYDKALASGKLVTLFFYANWCPICRVEFPKMQEAFNKVSHDQVVGFRVNYNDNETDSDEKSLAREFGVAYQHTKVFVKNGQRVLKAPESWNSADTYISKINEFK